MPVPDGDTNLQEIIISHQHDAFLFNKIEHCLRNSDAGPSIRCSPLLMKALIQIFQKELKAHHYNNVNYLLTFVQHLASDTSNEEGLPVLLENGLPELLVYAYEDIAKYTSPFCQDQQPSPADTTFLQLLETINDVADFHSSSKESLAQLFAEKLMVYVVNLERNFATRMEAVRTLNLLLEGCPVACLKGLQATSGMHRMLERFAEFLPRCGDFEMQVACTETLARVVKKSDREAFGQRCFKDRGLSERFLQMRDACFEVDCRTFLNTLNRAQDHETRVYSIPCIEAFLGSYKLRCPQDEQLMELWVDFNTSSRSITIYVADDSSTNENEDCSMWETVTVSDAMVVKCEIKKHGESQQHLAITMNVPADQVLPFSKNDEATVLIVFSLDHDLHQPLRMCFSPEKLHSQVRRKSSECSIKVLFKRMGEGGGIQTENVYTGKSVPQSTTHQKHEPVKSLSVPLKRMKISTPVSPMMSRVQQTHPSSEKRRKQDIQPKTPQQQPPKRAKTPLNVTVADKTSSGRETTPVKTPVRRASVSEGTPVNTRPSDRKTPDKQSSIKQASVTRRKNVSKEKSGANERTEQDITMNGELLNGHMDVEANIHGVRTPKMPNGQPSASRRKARSEDISGDLDMSDEEVPSKQAQESGMPHTSAGSPKGEFGVSDAVGNDKDGCGNIGAKAERSGTSGSDREKKRVPRRKSSDSKKQDDEEADDESTSRTKSGRKAREETMEQMCDKDGLILDDESSPKGAPDVSDGMQNDTSGSNKEKKRVSRRKSSDSKKQDDEEAENESTSKMKPGSKVKEEKMEGKCDNDGGILDNESETIDGGTDGQRRSKVDEAEETSFRSELDGEGSITEQEEDESILRNVTDSGRGRHQMDVETMSDTKKTVGLEQNGADKLGQMSRGVQKTGRKPRDGSKSDSGTARGRSKTESARHKDRGFYSDQDAAGLKAGTELTKTRSSNRNRHLPEKSVEPPDGEGLDQSQENQTAEDPSFPEQSKRSTKRDQRAPPPSVLPMDRPEDSGVINKNKRKPGGKLSGTSDLDDNLPVIDFNVTSRKEASPCKDGTGDENKGSVPVQERKINAKENSKGTMDRNGQSSDEEGDVLQNSASPAQDIAGGKVKSSTPLQRDAYTSEPVTRNPILVDREPSQSSQLVICETQEMVPVADQKKAQEIERLDRPLDSLEDPSDRQDGSSQGRGRTRSSQRVRAQRGRVPARKSPRIEALENLDALNPGQKKRKSVSGRFKLYSGDKKLMEDTSQDGYIPSTCQSQDSMADFVPDSCPTQQDKSQQHSATPDLSDIPEKSTESTSSETEAKRRPKRPRRKAKGKSRSKRTAKKAKTKLSKKDEENERSSESATLHQTREFLSSSLPVLSPPEENSADPYLFTDVKESVKKATSADRGVEKPKQKSTKAKKPNLNVPSMKLFQMKKSFMSFPSKSLTSTVVEHSLAIDSGGGDNMSGGAVIENKKSNRKMGNQAGTTKRARNIKGGNPKKHNAIEERNERDVRSDENNPQDDLATLESLEDENETKIRRHGKSFETARKKKHGKERNRVISKDGEISKDEEQGEVSDVEDQLEHSLSDIEPAGRNSVPGEESLKNPSTRAKYTKKEMQMEHAEMAKEPVERKSKKRDKISVDVMNDKVGKDDQDAESDQGDYEEDEVAFIEFEEKEHKVKQDNWKQKGQKTDDRMTNKVKNLSSNNFEGDDTNVDNVEPSRESNKKHGPTKFDEEMSTDEQETSKEKKKYKKRTKSRRNSVTASRGRGKQQENRDGFEEEGSIEDPNEDMGSTSPKDTDNISDMELVISQYNSPGVEASEANQDLGKEFDTVGGLDGKIGTPRREMDTPTAGGDNHHIGSVGRGHGDKALSTSGKAHSGRSFSREMLNLSDVEVMRDAAQITEDFRDDEIEGVLHSLKHFLDEPKKQREHRRKDNKSKQYGLEETSSQESSSKVPRLERRTEDNRKQRGLDVTSSQDSSSKAPQSTEDTRKQQDLDAAVSRECSSRDRFSEQGKNRKRWKVDETRSRDVSLKARTSEKKMDHDENHQKDDKADSSEVSSGENMDEAMEEINEELRALSKELQGSRKRRKFGADPRRLEVDLSGRPSSDTKRRKEALTPVAGSSKYGSEIEDDEGELSDVNLDFDDSKTEATVESFSKICKSIVCQSVEGGIAKNRSRRHIPKVDYRDKDMSFSDEEYDPRSDEQRGTTTSTTTQGDLYTTSPERPKSCISDSRQSEKSWLVERSQVKVSTYSTKIQRSDWMRGRKKSDVFKTLKKAAAHEKRQRTESDDIAAELFAPKKKRKKDMSPAVDQQNLYYLQDDDQPELGEEEAHVQKVLSMGPHVESTPDPSHLSKSSSRKIYMKRSTPGSSRQSLPSRKSQTSFISRVKERKPRKNLETDEVYDGQEQRNRQLSHQSELIPRKEPTRLLSEFSRSKSPQSSLHLKSSKRSATSLVSSGHQGRGKIRLDSDSPKSRYSKALSRVSGASSGSKGEPSRNSSHGSCLGKSPRVQDGENEEQPSPFAEASQATSDAIEPESQDTALENDNDDVQQADSQIVDERNYLSGPSKEVEVSRSTLRRKYEHLISDITRGQEIDIDEQEEVVVGPPTVTRKPINPRRLFEEELAQQAVDEDADVADIENDDDDSNVPSSSSGTSSYKYPSTNGSSFQITDMMAMLGQRIQKQIAERKQQTRLLTDSALKATQSHVNKIWTQQNKRRSEAHQRFTESLIDEIVGLEVDVSNMMKINEKMHATLRKTRMGIDSKYSKLLKTLHDNHMKDLSELDDYLGKTLKKSVRAIMDQELANMKHRIIGDLQMQDMNQMRLAMQSFFDI